MKSEKKVSSLSIIIIIYLSHECNNIINYNVIDYVLLYTMDDVVLSDNLYARIILLRG